MNLRSAALELFSQEGFGQEFDCLAYALIDFKSSKVLECFEMKGKKFSDDPVFYFDLASLTKPLTLSSIYHRHPDLFSADMKLLLNHRAGLPAWEKLGSDWREYLKSFPIKESETVYSDLSALRLMLELENVSGKKVQSLADFFWHKELCFWQDLPPKALCPSTGIREGRLLKGEVNDDNAFAIKEFCTHAGLFATVNGVAGSLLNLNKETGFVEKINLCDERFNCGWDTADSKNTLAGDQCSPGTFGHLGFTGTSIWIDTSQGIGQVLLTNVGPVPESPRESLGNLRRSLGNLGWLHCNSN